MPSDFTKKLTQKLKAKIKHLLGRSPQTTQANPDMWPWIRQTFAIKTIIDIGANNGDFAEFLATYFNAEATYVFEPLPTCLSDLEQKKQTIKNLHIFNVALSSNPGQQTFFANDYGPASSLLRVSDSSKTEFPQTSQESSTLVEVATLDSLLAKANLTADVLIKIDVQGLEDKVIQGGLKTFGQATCVLIEMSFVPMYVGQPLFGDVHSLLASLGYTLAGIKNQVCSPTTGQPLFAHCLYLRQTSTN
jgi:FkbM family methyltransferase